MLFYRTRLPDDDKDKTYADKDEAPDLEVPKFLPENTPGLHLPEDRTKGDTLKYLSPGRSS